MSDIKTGSKQLALSLAMVLAATTAGTVSAQTDQSGTMAGQTSQHTEPTTSTTQGASGTAGATGSSEQTEGNWGADGANGTSQTQGTSGTAGTTGMSQQTQGGSGAAGATGAGAAQKGAAGKAPVVLMLVPVDVAAKDSTTKSGCWVRIYDGENYMGDSLTLAGPVSLADMSGPFGLNWDDRVNSVQVGPKASMTVYDNEGYRDQVAWFKSGQNVPDISRKLGFFDEFASVRVTCTK